MGSAFGAGDDVIQRQVLGATAVLTGVVVATKDFPPIDRRYFPVPLWITTRQPDVIRNLEYDTGRSHFPLLGTAELQSLCLSSHQERDRPFNVDSRQGEVVLREHHDLVLKYWNFLSLLGLHEFSPQKTAPAPGNQKRGLGKLLWLSLCWCQGYPAPPAASQLIRIESSGDVAINAFADGFTAAKPIRPLKRKQRRCSAQT
jgi:hypothetical protein